MILMILKILMNSKKIHFIRRDLNNYKYLFLTKHMQSDLSDPSSSTINITPNKQLSKGVFFCIGTIAILAEIMITYMYYRMLTLDFSRLTIYIGISMIYVLFLAGVGFFIRKAYMVLQDYSKFPQHIKFTPKEIQFECLDSKFNYVIPKSEIGYIETRAHSTTIEKQDRYGNIQHLRRYSFMLHILNPQRKSLFCEWILNFTQDRIKSKDTRYIDLKKKIDVFSATHYAAESYSVKTEEKRSSLRIMISIFLYIVSAVILIAVKF